MKDLSFFFLKNIMGAKMRRGFHSFCNNDNSTSTLNQHKNDHGAPRAGTSPSSSYAENDRNALDNAPGRKSVTLEEMILQLELEEEKSRREGKAADDRRYRLEEAEAKKPSFDFPRRMSCVNNADILRSARNALSQYPRFSLDGRDAMYRSSFCGGSGPSLEGLKLGRILRLPQSLGGESVVWCRPGVVPKLMGLDAMPVPIGRLSGSKIRQGENNEKMMRSRDLRRGAQRNRNMYAMDSSWCRGNNIKGSSSGKPSSSMGYCVMNPIAIEPVYGYYSGGSVSYNW